MSTVNCSKIIINGLCKPGAKYEECDGLFVYHTKDAHPVLAVYFEKGRETIGIPTKEEFDTTFNSLKQDGWSPLTDDLLEKLRW